MFGIVLIIIGVLLFLYGWRSFSKCHKLRKECEVKIPPVLEEPVDVDCTDNLHNLVVKHINDRYGYVGNQDEKLHPDVDNMLRTLCKRYLNLDRDASFIVNFTKRDSPVIEKYNEGKTQELILPYSQYNALIRHILGQGLMYETKSERYKDQYTVHIKMPIDFTGNIYKNAYDYKNSGNDVHISSDIMMKHDAYFNPDGLYRTGEGYIKAKK